MASALNQLTDQTQFNNTLKKFNLNTIDRYTYYLRYNVETFLQLYQYFIQNNLKSIINYFENSIAQPDRQSFDFLNRLIIESDKINNLIKLNKNSFSHIDDWEMLDFLQDIRNKLQTIKNTDRWTRSSKTQNSWQGNALQTNYVLGDHETIEKVSNIIYGETGSQDDWMRIAIENDISERDYTTKGGNILKVTKQTLTSPNYFIYSIIDNLINEKMYGIDINKKITFIGSDLEILNYNNTVVQSVEILILIKKGDVPEFSAIGVDPKMLIGNNYGALKYSSIIRQLNDVFSTDDSLRNFQVTNVSYKNGALTIDYKVDTLYNLTYNNAGVQLVKN